MRQKEKKIHLVFYRGAPVLVVKALKYQAFSVGLTVIGAAEYRRSEKGLSETLDHEYGHFLQLLILGLPVYLLFYAFPSFVCYWSGVPESRYYGLPWEYIADRLGGTKRNNSTFPRIGWCYFVFSLILCWIIRIFVLWWL